MSEQAGDAAASTTNRRAAVIAGVVGAAVGAGAVVLSGQFGAAPQRAQVEAIVGDYIRANPEIIREAAQALQQDELAKVVEANRTALETPYGSAWAGAANGDVVLVEFFDYACGYCRKSIADMNRLLAEDKGLKVVWRELPVLGQNSLTAAEASLAAARQGKFRAFYDRLFALGRPSDANVAAARQAVGVTTEVAPPGDRAEIERNYELARAIGATGTPTFVIGDQVLQGAVGYEALKAAIAAARAR